MKWILKSNFFIESSSPKISISKQNVVSLLENLPVPKLQEGRVIKCEGEITESELLKSLKSMKNDKSPGNDGLTKVLWNLLERN